MLIVQCRNICFYLLKIYFFSRKICRAFVDFWNTWNKFWRWSKEMFLTFIRFICLNLCRFIVVILWDELLDIGRRARMSWNLNQFQVGLDWRKNIVLHHAIWIFAKCDFSQGWEFDLWFLVRIARFLRAKEIIALFILFKRVTRSIPSFTKSEKSDEERLAFLFWA